MQLIEEKGSITLKDIENVFNLRYIAAQAKAKEFETMLWIEKTGDKYPVSWKEGKAFPLR